MSVYFTPQAEIDLEEIGDYIALDNPRRALTFIQEIRQHCERIADGPTRYAARPELGEAIRICPHRNYLIVFEPYDRGVLILRVLQGARNLPVISPASSAVAENDWPLSRRTSNIRRRRALRGAA